MYMYTIGHKGQEKVNFALVYVLLVLMRHLQAVCNWIEVEGICLADTDTTACEH